MRAAYSRDVAVLPRERVAAIIESGGFTDPRPVLPGRADSRLVLDAVNGRSTITPRHGGCIRPAEHEATRVALVPYLRVGRCRDLGPVAFDDRPCRALGCRWPVLHRSAGLGWLLVWLYRAETLVAALRWLCGWANSVSARMVANRAIASRRAGVRAAVLPCLSRRCLCRLPSPNQMAGLKAAAAPWRRLMAPPRALG